MLEWMGTAAPWAPGIAVAVGLVVMRTDLKTIKSELRSLSGRLSKVEADLADMLPRFAVVESKLEDLRKASNA